MKDFNRWGDILNQMDVGYKYTSCPQCGRQIENIAGSKRLSRCQCGYYEGCC